MYQNSPDQSSDNIQNAPERYLIDGGATPDYPNQPEEDFSIKRLVMIRITQCMICHTIQPIHCNQVLIGFRWGWLYCNDCLVSGKLRTIVLGWINITKTIPCTWLIGSQIYHSSDNKNTPPCIYLKFFRYSRRDTSEPVYEGRLYPCDTDGTTIRHITDPCECYSMSLSFNDPGSKQDLERLVSIANIFAHNPDFYQSLINSQNLLHHPELKIAYSDISQEFRDGIDRCYQTSQVSNPKEFQF